ncbi:MAG: serine/threonine protein kinase [Deltaproteobacteria bacterium]|nr:serine/threonine protein kinase [Deltaproteobacteria bacterium]
MIAVGQTIGNYQITAKLGEGGMGVVYLAEHPVIGRKVAMKAIHPELSRNPEVVSRFVTEAKAVNQIGNEHIVDIHDFGTTADGEFYFIMEFLQGEALVDRLKRSSPLELERALSIAAQVTDALGASHQHGIIHRDLKPENVFLITKGHSPDFVKVLDFGLAKLTQGEDKVSHKTRTGSVMGTPYYMSPEQCEGKPNIDHRSDIYSLGVILFEMTTGKIPFGGEGYGEIIVKHITAPVPSPRTINPLLPSSVEAIVLRALAKRRDERFQTMEEFAAALQDPDGYAAAAPLFDIDAAPSSPIVVPGAEGVTPGVRADSVVSGKVVFGDPDQELGAQASPMPTTFRNATGELTDEDFAPVRRSRKAGLWLVMAAAAVAAGAAAYLYTQQKPVETQAGPTALAPQRPPKQVRLTLKSDPPGATVLRKDTNEQLGLTPLAVELPAGNTPIEFVFRKDTYRERTESFVPTVPGKLAVALVAEPPPPQEQPKPRAEAKPEARAKAGKGSRRRPAASRRRPSHTMDEDGVLAPSF